MKKQCLTLFLLALITTTVFAQEVTPTVVIIGNQEMNAFTTTLPLENSVVEQALKQKTKDMKLKTKKVNGFQASLAMPVNEISMSPIDFYIQLTKQKQSTIITACALKEGLSNDTLNQAVSSFLRNFATYADRYEATALLSQTEKELKKAQKEAKAAAAALAAIDKANSSDKKKREQLAQEIEKCKQRINECEREISQLDKAMDKRGGSERTEAEQKVNDTQQRSENLELELQRIRARLQ